MAILDDTRADWKARPPTRARTVVPWSQRIGVSWHWIGPGKGPSALKPHTMCLAQVLDWQHQHQTRAGDPWKDIGYNALICQHARAIEGRGLEFSGSHSPGVNTSHVGIQFMVGTTTPGGVTPAMYARAVRLRADIGALGKNIRRDWGHRDDPKTSTECPGDAIYKWVHSGGPLHAPTTTTPEEDMPLTDADVAKILSTRAIPADMLGVKGQLITIPRAFDLLLRWSLEGRDAGLRSEAIAKALAAKGEALTAAEVDAIGAAVGKQIAAGFEVDITPKATA